MHGWLTGMGNKSHSGCGVRGGSKCGVATLREYKRHGDNKRKRLAAFVVATWQMTWRKCGVAGTVSSWRMCPAWWRGNQA